MMQRMMDLQMPVLSELDGTPAILQMVGLGSGELPFLALTANAMTADVQSCLDHGINGHIAKPNRPSKNATKSSLVRHLPACDFKLN